MKGVNIDLTREQWKICMEYLLIDADKNQEIIKKFEEYALFRHWRSEVQAFKLEKILNV
ncbi:MAG: hypothetical protein ACFFC3_13260 [Candidatus Odinarchaeota archaeon]